MTLLWISLAWVLGIFLGLRLDVPLSALGMFLLVAALLFVLARVRRWRALAAILVLVAVLGGLRVQGLSGSDADPSLRDYFTAGPVQVRGTVVSDPQPAGSSVRLRLSAETVEADSGPEDVHGDLLVTLRESPDLVRQREKPFFRYGDVLLLDGRLEGPPSFEDFDYAAYLSRQGITAVMSFPDARLLDSGQGNPGYQRLYRLRQRLAEALGQGVPEPQASVTQALLLGLRKNLPEDLTESFNNTGTTHLLAISGLHVGILLGIAIVASETVLGRRRRLYLILPLVMVWFYALITGMSPSVTRAAVMATVYLFGRYMGRPGSIMPALGLAAAVMVGLDPDILWDVSFQLSFVAVTGIAVLGQPVRDWLRNALDRLPVDSRALPPLFVASDLLAVTVAATVATYPLIAFYFHRVSLVGVPATLVTLPVLPLVLSLGALTAFVGTLSAAAAQPLGWVAWAFAAYLTGAIRFFSDIPSASIEVGRLGPFFVWIYYATLLLAVSAFHLRGSAWFAAEIVPKLKAALANGRVPAKVLVPLLAAAALVWVAVLWTPDGRLRVVFLDVGQGDSIFISAPGGQQILIDGGPDPLGAVNALGERMPFWDRSLDLVVLTHPHQDHVNGLREVLRRYRVDRILERRVEYDSPAYAAWRHLVEEEGASIVQAQQGQIIAFEGGLSLRVLWPTERLLEHTSSDANNGSVVLHLSHGEVSFLLTGDIHGEAERVLLQQDVNLDSTVLKVAHQGSKTSSTPTFIEEVSPAAAVILVGRDNRFGHPHVEAVDTLLEYVPQDRLFITRDHGDIRFTSDGTRLWADLER